VVDEINDTEEIVVKPLRKQLKTVKTFAGRASWVTAKVALILDVLGLAQRAGVVTETRNRALTEKATESPRPPEKRKPSCSSRAPATVAWPYRSARWRPRRVFRGASGNVRQPVGHSVSRPDPSLIRLNVVLQEQEREKDRRNKLRTMQAPPTPDSGPIQVWCSITKGGPSAWLWNGFSILLKTGGREAGISSNSVTRSPISRRNRRDGPRRRRLHVRPVFNNIENPFHNQAEGPPS